MMRRYISIFLALTACLSQAGAEPSSGFTVSQLSAQEPTLQLASYLRCDTPEPLRLPSRTRRTSTMREMTLGAMLNTLTAVPHRRAGTQQGRRTETFLANAFQAVGCTVSRQEVPVHDWECDSARLTVGEESLACSAVPYTSFGAVSGRLVYAGSAQDLAGLNVAGAVVVAEQRFPEQPVEQLWAQRLRGTTVTEPGAGIPAWWLNAPGITPAEAEEAGAVGLVHILVDQMTDSPARYCPYQGPTRGVPTVYVCRNEGKRLMEAASANRDAVLCIEGRLNRTFGNNIIAELSGNSGRVYLFESHYDSPFAGAVDDASSVVALLELARHFAALPEQQRPGRLVFACTTGHFDASVGVRMLARDILPQWRYRYRGIFSLEQIGARAVRQEGGRLVPTDSLVRQDVFVPENDRLRSAVQAALEAAQLSNTLVLPDRTEIYPMPPGEGGSLAVAGLPTVQFTSAPPYLLTSEDSADKVDLARVAKQVDLLIDIVGRL